MPFAEAQAAFAEHGQRLAWDPPDPGRSDDRRDRGHGRLRPAAPPLRRRARPRRRHQRGAQRRHDRQVRRQGDQERRGLRPREAVRRLVRDARADRVGLGAPAPAARRAPRPRRDPSDDDPDELLRRRAATLARRPLEADSLRRRLDGTAARAHRCCEFRGAGGARARRMPRRATRRATRTGTTCARCSAGDGVVLKVSGRPTDLPNVIRAAGATRHGRLARRARAVVDRARSRRGLVAARSAQALAPRALHRARRRRPRVSDAGPTPARGRS